MHNFRQFFILLAFSLFFVQCFKRPSLHRQLYSSLYAKKNWAAPASDGTTGGFSRIATLPQADATGGLTYTVEMTKRSGISWGSDLSFSYVYVLDMEQSGEASASRQIEKVERLIVS